MSSILVTGGTGSFGQAFIRRLLDTDTYERIVVFSRDELKQYEMRQAGLTDSRLRYFIGDVRDRDRLKLALEGVNDVVHAAAMKQVDTCERNPSEAKKTNVDGTENVIYAARNQNVSRVLMIGTDKAVDPVNLYGSTKQVAERLMVDANESYTGTRFACTRYGNVISSRGAVLPRFQAQHGKQPLTVTDPEMTRFVLTLQQGVTFVLNCLREMRGGEVFVPKLPTVTVETIAAAVSWPAKPDMEIVGRRPGEKQHERLISLDESVRARFCGDHYVIHPVTTRLEPGEPFIYSSDGVHLDVAGFRELAGLGATLEATG